MSFFSNLMYEVQEMFIEGLTAIEIANRLDLPVEQIVAVLEDFGVEADGVGEAEEAALYYGA